VLTISSDHAGFLSSDAPTTQTASGTSKPNGISPLHQSTPGDTVFVATASLQGLDAFPTAVYPTDEAIREGGGGGDGGGDGQGGRVRGSGSGISAATVNSVREADTNSNTVRATLQNGALSVVAAHQGSSLARVQRSGEVGGRGGNSTAHAGSWRRIHGASDSLPTAAASLPVDGAKIAWRASPPLGIAPIPRSPTVSPSSALRASARSLPIARQGSLPGSRWG
jgi:hypothetical protein